MQIDKKFKSISFLRDKTGNIVAQPINSNNVLFHLITKEKHYEKPKLEQIKICLNALKDYCLKKNITELHMPHICSGLDGHNFTTIRELIREIFATHNVNIFIHTDTKEVYLSDNASVLAQIDESESPTYQTVHSDEENDVNNITFKETSINVGKNQIIMSVHERETEIKIRKLFGNQKQRFTVKFDRYGLGEEIKKFIKDYLTPNCKYYCLIEGELHLTLNNILMQNFVKGSYEIIKCEYLAEDIESPENQIETIMNYHEGKTNHRGIQETYLKLKNKYYWPNMLVDIQKYINNCEICLANKYERQPIKLDNNLTETPKRPFEKISVDTLTLQRKKYLTIIDQFSKHAQVYYLKNLNATTIADALVKYFNNYKVPNEITHDAGTEFNNNLVKELLNSYKIKVHMTCIANPKSNGIIERFHSTLIEHLRIINQRMEMKNVNSGNKIKMALIAYNNSINLITKLSPNEILFGKIKQYNPFENNATNDDYLENYNDELKIIHEIVRNKIVNEKLKRYKQEHTLPNEIPNQVRIKANKRLISKIKKPLYHSNEVKSYDPKLGVIKLNENRKFKLNKKT